MTYDRQYKLHRYLEEIMRHEDGGVQAIAPVVGSTSLTTERVAEDSGIMDANSALEKIKAGKGVPLTAGEQFATEAIIIPSLRPAIDIIDGQFTTDHQTWLTLNENTDARRNLLAAIPAIGRIELPGQQRIPYGGTGFLVGNGLMMTNRHVAEIFAQGLGDRHIDFRPGSQAAADMLHERDRPETEMLQVKGVRLIHPYWDMALLEVEGPAAQQSGLRLSLMDLGDLDGREVAVIGYPAFDPRRNDVETQNWLFDKTFGVKRLQPGRLGKRVETESFGKLVLAGSHDCSTLGGNSGSAVIDLKSGEVLALHFGGRQFETNWCVPSFEMAKDGRVVDSGIRFAGTPTGSTPPWQRFWDDITETTAEPAPPLPPPPALSAAGAGDGSVSFTIPLHITVRLGQPGEAATLAVAPATLAATPLTEGLVEPDHDTNYASRMHGYDPGFLPGVTVPLPVAKDPSVLAPVRSGDNTLIYENFSIQMHAARRIALFTASNVTAEKRLRRPEPGRDYSRAGLSGLGPNDREKWFTDPRLEERYQLPDAFFTKDRNTFDKGHIVRRDDVAWGASYAALRRANGDTYHVTNCSPQLAQFNQSTKGPDNWGDLENLVLGAAASERLCVFAGPVLAAKDPPFVSEIRAGVTIRAQIPQSFWKLIVARTANGIAAYAFLLEQDLRALPHIELTIPENFRRKMVPIAQLESLTDIRFPPNVRAADQFAQERGIELTAWAGIDHGTRRDAADQPTPNRDDDAEAAHEAGGDAEAAAAAHDAEGIATAASPRDWRTAEALKALLAQVNAVAPRRSHLSDGTIGDAAHASRSSDHNPWVVDGDMGVVTALDITHDPARDCDAGHLAEAIRASRDHRVKYIIWNRRIANAAATGGAAAWDWRPYTGTNPHNKHVHISVKPEKALYDLRMPWSISGLSGAEEMMPVPA